MVPIFFTAGFLWDNITFQRIDLFYENAVLVWDLVAAAAIIVTSNAYEAGRVRGRIADKVVPFFPLFLQFAFGGLFSAFLLFYTRSGAWGVSWPFLLVLAVLFFGNEFFKKRYQRFIFQMSVYFTALFFYLVFLLPVLTGKMGVFMFLASGVLALAGISCILLIFRYVIPGRVARSKKALVGSIGTIYVIINVFYFTNLIPPIPLALKEGGLYHSVARASQGNYLYKVTFEPAPWYVPFAKTSDTFHWQRGNAVYSYSAVFAPTRIETTIFHRWMFYDEQTERWIERSRIALPITGGRDGGYRGYTFKRAIEPGRWRVDVITGRGQVIDRRNFTVVEVTSPPELKTDFR